MKTAKQSQTIIEAHKNDLAIAEEALAMAQDHLKEKKNRVAIIKKALAHHETHAKQVASLKKK